MSSNLPRRRRVKSNMELPCFSIRHVRDKNLARDPVVRSRAVSFQREQARPGRGVVYGDTLAALFRRVESGTVDDLGVEENGVTCSHLGKDKFLRAFSFER